MTLLCMQDITRLSQLQLDDSWNGLTAPSLDRRKKKKTTPVLAATPRGWRMLTSESVPGSQKGPAEQEAL